MKARWCSNNLLLTTSCATVFIGTLYPLALEAITGEKISVGPPFFNFTFVPLFVPIFLAMPLGQALAWKRGDFLGSAQRLTLACIVAICAGLLLAALRGEPVVSAVFAGLAVFVIIGSFAEIATRISGGGLAPGKIFSRALGLPFSAWGAALAHAGVGVTLFGLAATGWGVEKIIAMRIGDQVGIGPYALTLDAVAPRKGPNYDETVARMTIRSGGVEIGRIEPSRKYFRVRQTTTTDAGLRTLFARTDLCRRHRAACVRRHRCAHVLEAICGADLARRADHGAWRRRIVGRSQIARRGRSPRACAAHGAAGGVGR